MKKILSLILATLAVCATFLFTACGSSNNTLKNPEGKYDQSLAGTTLNVYNWGEYISDGSEDTLDVNAAFEKLTGIKVNYITYDSNEVMYSKLKGGAETFDIIIPSDYMIQRLISEDMLMKFNVSELSNYHYIDDQYKGLYYDPDNAYSVPYNVGMVGLLYNKSMVQETVDSWSIMWDSKYSGQILTFNNSRDAFGIAQFLLGQDVNSTDRADWDAAERKLKEQNTVLQGRVMDEVFVKMENGNAAIAPYYAGDCLSMMENNKDLELVFPKEGVNIFVDAVCIPKNAQNVEAAKLYINFLLEPEVALANAETLCYASPNTAVVNNEEYSLYGNKYLYPSEADMPKTQYFHDLPEDVRSYYEDLWTEVIRDKG